MIFNNPKPINKDKKNKTNRRIYLGSAKNGAKHNARTSKNISENVFCFFRSNAMRPIGAMMVKIPIAIAYSAPTFKNIWRGAEP